MSNDGGPDVPWELLGTFLAVMRHGSLSGAARALGLAQPTVRRRIEALEEALDVALFTRAPNGLEPTAAAFATVPHAEAMDASARALSRAASDAAGAEGGTVRLTTSHVIGVEVVPPILAALRRRHPRLQIELALSDRRQDLLRRDADVAVRMVRPTQRALVAKRVGEVELGLFATAGYLAERPAPDTLDALITGDHVLVGPDRASALVEALRGLGAELRHGRFALRADQDLAQLAAVRAGFGIGVCQVPIARRDGLVRVLPELAFPLEVWVVTHEDLREVRRVRLLFDALVAGLSDHLQA
jgi:DNA-binding transcriptional LysR family regulator